MAIAKALMEKICAAYTPAAPIQSEDLFAGRTSQLERVDAAVGEAGQHAALFGERGVGKTSLANVIKARTPALKVSCDSRDTFASIWKRVFREVELEHETEGIGFKPSKERSTISLSDLAGTAINGAADLAHFIKKHEIRGLVIIDEYDQVTDEKSREYMADLLKNLSDNWHGITVLLVGVAENVNGLIGNHPSVERCLKQIEVPRMSTFELEEILDKGSKITGSPSRQT